MEILVEKNSPLMQQYFDIKAQYPDSVLLFQVGDFYELFFQDAKTVSSFLAIALTKRGKNKGQDIPLCGIPVHALNHYLIKLIKGGFKVAICEQITKPQPGVMVQRKVTKVYTPGTLTESSMLDEKSASYILVFYPLKDSWGLIFTELLTAQIFATYIPEGAFRSVESELIRFFPDEIILPDLKNIKTFEYYFKQNGYLVSFANFLTNLSLEQDLQEEKLWQESQFNSITNLKIQENLSIDQALKTLYFYLKKNNQESLNQFKNINFYNSQDYLILDFSTQKNLEIIKNSQDGSRKNSLLSVMDKARTAMGSRTVKKWLLRPLISKDSILQRQQVITFFVKNIDLLQKLEEILSQICDLERIVGRIALNRANLQDYLALKNSLKVIPELKKILYKDYNFYLVNLIYEKLIDFSVLIDFLESSLNEDFSFNWVIKKGFDLELDHLRDLVLNAQKEILKLEEKEISRTNINSLKIRYNNITGYYIEITNPNLSLVPQDYKEIQQLSNRKRFVTQDLKNLERDILRAQTEIESVEQKVFQKVKDEVLNNLSSLRQLAQAVSYIDALFSFSKIAYENNYVAPVFNNNREIIINQGRHPVIETNLEGTFEPNDTNLTDQESLWIITGPNMGGKSTYLRQVALICIMAQTGSFIPASFANLSILDRIFTRIGAGDNLAEGKSTFLVEMEETATICRQATKNSLVILDEVGRGTSTNDGIALAQAIIEYIFLNIQARSLFATHYHELTHLQEKLNGVSNYYMLSKKSGESVIFLHKIKKGISEGSFGIQVAKLANLPDVVIDRARELLNLIENNNIKDNNFVPAQKSKNFNIIEEKINYLEKELKIRKDIIDYINNLNLEDLSPKQAYDFLWDLKNKKSLF